MHTIRLTLLLLALPFSLLAQFDSGEELRITQAYDDDYYAAGGEISIEAVIAGDLIAAGGEINVRDSVGADLTLAGGEMMISGSVGDDLRLAGGRITINGPVHDDAVIFGGQIEIGPDAIITGDLIVFGGEITVNGQVMGAVRISGGQININGTIHGPAQISAGELELGEQAEFRSDVDYWTEKGEIDFGSSLVGGAARFDESKSWEAKDYSDPMVGIGFGIVFGMIFLLAGVLMIMILNWAFGTWFDRAASEVQKDWVRSLGSGLIYVLGVPLLIALGFMILIGIPLSLFLLCFYVFSMLFGSFVAALILSYILSNRGQSEWPYWKIVLIAFLIAIGIQIITSIPFIGTIISFVVITITYGAIGLALKHNSTTPGPIVHA